MFHGHSICNEGRARDLVRGQVSVDVYHNAGIVHLIELRAQSSGRLFAAGAGDLEIDALRIILRTICSTGGVESDDLMAKDVVTRCDALRDRDSPAVIIRNQLIRTPRSRNRVIVDKTDFVNLEELERGLVDI